METKWLEDFVSLAATRSYSRSAQMRHVTQPAFSRRIQALFFLSASGPPVPLLAHAAGACMGHMVEQIIRQPPPKAL